jgi:hypothetical protein
VAAAAAVITVVAGVTVISREAANRPGQAAGSAGAPRYYVTLLTTLHHQRSPGSSQGKPKSAGRTWVTDTATVRESATGQVVATLAVPAPPFRMPGWTNVAAAANDRLFVISAGSGLFLLHLAADGHPTALRRISLGHDRVSQPNGAALSPDGSQIAFTVMHCATKYCSFGIEVLSLATGTRKTWYSGWLGANNANLSWTGDGRQVFFQAYHSKHWFWLLNAAGPGGNLATDSRPSAIPYTSAAVLPTGDGRSVIISTIANGDHGRTEVGKIEELSMSTGKLERVLYTATIRYHGDVYGSPYACEAISLGPTGLQPLVVCFGFGRIHGTTFTPLPDGSVPGASGQSYALPYWDAAW